jgi:hypothetical protein
MISHGIIIGTETLPGTERVVRDSSAWWDSGDLGTRPRKGHRASLIVGHWTAGHARTGPGTGAKVVRAMKARKRGDGTPMDVGVHFVIGWDGLVFQTADLALATTHVGHRPTILASIGVECCWPGTMTQADKLGMPAAAPARGVARGAAVKAYPPSDELVEAWRWLVGALTTARHPLLAVPRASGSCVPQRPGIVEHRDVPGSTKIDAAGLLVGALGLVPR